MIILEKPTGNNHGVLVAAGNLESVLLVLSWCRGL